MLWQQSILEYNGAAILAMTGKDCVGICSDSRLGNQAQTVATDFEKIFKMGDKLMVRAKPCLYLLAFHRLLSCESIDFGHLIPGTWYFLRGANLVHETGTNLVRTWYTIPYDSWPLSYDIRMIRIAAAVITQRKEYTHQ